MGAIDGEGSRLSRIYQERFSPEELAFKRRMWEVLCRDFFQRYVSSEDTVLDLGAGTCEFINAIRCRSKIAVDLNPDIKSHALDAMVIVTPSTDLHAIGSGSVDVVFTSNFLEHLRDKEEVLLTLEQCARVVRTGGRIIVLMPNIRYLTGRYWDYFDHHVPLTHLSVSEALTIAGFRIERVTSRFLPYTVKSSRIPRSLAALRLYLRLPILWKVFGRQMLVIGSKDD